MRELEEETGWGDVTLLGEVDRRSFDMDYDATDQAVWPSHVADLVRNAVRQ